MHSSTSLLACPIVSLTLVTAQLTPQATRDTLLQGMDRYCARP
jgi:hypothetical protein